MELVGRYYASYIFAGLSAVGLAFGGWGNWLAVMLLFVIHPMLDPIFGRAIAAPKEPPHGNQNNVVFFLAVLTVTVFVWWGASVYAAQSSVQDQIGVLLSVGLITGLIGIATAHELVHRQNERFRWMGYLILWQVCFGHWAVEHVFGHHKHVGTPQDPATPRRGEWLYLYWLRTYLVGYLSAWRIEDERLKRRSASARIGQNRVLMSSMVQLVMVGIFISIWGLGGAVFYLGQSAVAILLLKTVDYIEHYGLVRHMRPNGLYEPVRDEHSWDCDFRLTNWTLLNLGYHAHHHRKPLVEYQNLVTALGVKRMPFGYSLMILMAFVPPLYFSVMNPRIEGSSSNFA